MSQPSSRRRRGGGGLDWLAREGGGDAGTVIREQLLALAAPPAEGEHVVELEHGRIDPSPYQARRVFPAGPMDELTESIRLHGLLQPIVVRPGRGARYELVAGERRWRAIGRLGWACVPAVVRTIDDLTAHLLGQIENDVREDISAWERALGYVGLRAHLHQERGSLPTLAELGEIRGVDKSTVSRYLTVGYAFPPAAVELSGIAEETLAQLSLPVLLRAARKPESERLVFLDAKLNRRREPSTGSIGATRESEWDSTHEKRSEALAETPHAQQSLPGWRRYMEDRAIRIETTVPPADLTPEQARGAVERIVPALAALSGRVASAAVPHVLLVVGDGGRVLFVPDTLSEEQCAALDRLVRRLERSAVP